MLKKRSFKKNKRRLYEFLSGAVIFLCLTGCATVYNPATGKQEIIFIPTATESVIGRKMSAQIAKDKKFIEDDQEIERLTTIGKKIAAVSDRQDLEYRFYIIDEKEINAFTIPGGYVYVNSGLTAKATDDELACVVGHEIGHVAARHIAKKMQTQIGYSLIMDIAARKANITDIRTAVSITYDLISKGYSREDELEADRIGVRYAYKAGYDPRAMISFLNKMKEEDKSPKGLVFLRTHPYPDQRIAQLETEIPLITNQLTPPKAGNKNIAKPGSGNKTSNPDKSGQLSAERVSTTQQPRPGRVMCPECKKVFSGQTNYCPYDGKKLE